MANRCVTYARGELELSVISPSPCLAQTDMWTGNCTMGMTETGTHYTTGTPGVTVTISNADGSARFQRAPYNTTNLEGAEREARFSGKLRQLSHSMAQIESRHMKYYHGSHGGPVLAGGNGYHDFNGYYNHGDHVLAGGNGHHWNLTHMSKIC